MCFYRGSLKMKLWLLEASEIRRKAFVVQKGSRLLSGLVESEIMAVWASIES